MLTRRACLQAMSENEEIADLLEENKAEIDQLIETYNGFKELLDQHKLTEDLDQLLACVHRCHSKGEHTYRFQEDDQIANFSCRVQERETQSETTKPEGGVESGRS